MKIGIMGSGNIGGSLGRLWAMAKHEVLFSSRNPGSLDRLVALAGPNARVGTVAEAADFGEVILDALPFGKVHEVPAAKLTGKVVLSASNYYPSRDGEMDLKGLTQSEYIATLLPGARLVKAFNMMRADVMEQLANGAGRPGLAIFIAGDDSDAKAIASHLILDARFAPIDAGYLSSGALFQTDGPLYDTQLTREQAIRRLSDVRSESHRD